MAIRQPRYSKEEVGADAETKSTSRRSGRRSEPQDHGKYVAIDIETRQWEMDADEMAAGDRLRSRIPDAQIWMTRVGFGYTRRFGGASLRRQRVISRNGRLLHGFRLVMETIDGGAVRIERM